MNDVATRRPATASGEQPAAVSVVTGITGDLAEGDDVPGRCTDLEQGSLLS